VRRGRKLTRRFLTEVYPKCRTFLRSAPPPTLLPQRLWGWVGVLNFCLGFDGLLALVSAAVRAFMVLHETRRPIRGVYNLLVAGRVLRQARVLVSGRTRLSCADVTCTCVHKE